ncbi:MAG: hypothetical protein SFU83_21990 [Meiothermus sp.]|nr:hypothetical protein [Meiothermus sp.]
MSEYSDQLILHSDSDGFVSFNCPYCSLRFKLSAVEAQEDTILFFWCPSCGLRHHTVRFLSDEAKQAAQILAENLARQLINNMMKDIGKSFGKSKYVKVEGGKPLRMENEKVILEDHNLELVETKCCGKHMRVRLMEKIIGVYCAYCGQVNSWNTK